MEIIKTLCWIVQIISALSIIVLVLLQHGKGADAGATFGSGSSGSLFGATGSTSFLSRITAIFAVIFFSTTFGLVLLSANLGVGGGAGIMSNFNDKANLSTNVSKTASGVVADPSKDKAVSSAPAKGDAKNQIPG
jgi:preprotein translocase subunit SecG